MVCVCVCEVLETSTVCIILAVRPHVNQHPSDVTTDDDVTKMATPTWAESNIRRMLSVRDRKVLCSLTATIRPEAATVEGSGSVEEDTDIDETLLHFKHFIFKNRMRISQDC